MKIFVALKASIKHFRQKIKQQEKIMFEQLTTQLRHLKLNGMATAFTRQNEQPNTYDNLSFVERFQLLVDSESTERDCR